MKIFVVGTKKFPNDLPNEYVNILVNANNIQNDNATYCDNTGNNISSKNPNYCELTALYWIWKNIDDKTIGLVHYRRFFYNRYFVVNKKKVLTKDDIKEYLKNYDLIVPQIGYTFKHTVYDMYKEKHDIEDLDKCGEIIKKKYPKYYNSFKKVIYSNHYSQYNMFIGRKELIDRYCEWLFEVFTELEKTIDLDKKDKYNKRVYGFLSERLFNVWLLENDLKIKQLPVYNTEVNMFKQELNAIIKRVIFKNK